MLNIFSKELKSYFHSSIAYIFLFVFLLISGLFFALTNLQQGDGTFNYTIGTMVFLFLILSPVLTMKSLASETNDKTDQLLLTSPLRIWQIVIGKFLAAAILFLIGTAVTVIYPLILKSFGPIPAAQIFGSYLGFVLLGLCFIAVGLFISSLTSNQVIAYLGTFGALFIMRIADSIASGVPTTALSGAVFCVILISALCFFIFYNTKNIFLCGGTGVIGLIITAIVYVKNKTVFDGFLVNFFGWFSLFKRYDSFNLGVLSLSSLVYYLTFTIAFVFLTIVVIDRKRWS